MVAFNFKPRFAEDVANGVKRRTIRRKQRAKPMDKLQLYTGMMQKGKCVKLMDAICTGVRAVEIYPRLVYFPAEGMDYGGTAIADRYALDLFAKEDGFENWPDMVQWFSETYKGQFPVTGFIHEWVPDGTKEEKAA